MPILIQVLKQAKVIVEKLGLDKVAELDPNLEDFNNPNTLKRIKEIMEAHHVRVSSISHRGVNAYFGKSGASLSMWPKPGHITIQCIRLYECPAFNSGDITIGYTIHSSDSKYPSFRAWLTRFLEILDDAVQGRSTKDIEIRLEEEG